MPGIAALDSQQGSGSALLRCAAGAATTATVGVVLARSLLDGAETLAALAAAAIGTLLVPSVGFGEAEDAAVVALTLKAAKSGFERLVGTNGDLDQGSEPASGGERGAGVRLGAVSSRGGYGGTGNAATGLMPLSFSSVRDFSCRRPQGPYV